MQPYGIVKYQYDERKQVARILSYQRIWGTNRFKLSQLTENKYTYGSANQLQQLRATIYPGSQVVVYHWQGGDIIQKDEVPPPTSFGITATTRYSYGHELDPFTRSNFLFNSIYQSQHNLMSVMDPKGNSTLFDYRYQYDSQGRLVSQVLGDENGTGYWYGYTFDYAP